MVSASKVKTATAVQVDYIKGMLGVNVAKMPYDPIKRVALILCKTEKRFAERLRRYLLANGAKSHRAGVEKQSPGRKPKGESLGIVRTIELRNRHWLDKTGKKKNTAIERKIQSGFRLLRWQPGLFKEQLTFICPKGKKLVISQ